MEGLDLTIESMKEQLNGLKQRISQLRKKGMDTKIAELKLMEISPKIRLAEATRELKEAQRASRSLDDAKSEVSSLEQSLKEKIDGQELNSLVLEIDRLLKENKFKEAKECYIKCIDIYKNMPDKNKKEVFALLDGIRAKIG